MTCVLRLLEPDSASAVCCNVQLADYAGTFFHPSHTPPRSCGFAFRVGLRGTHQSAPMSPGGRYHWYGNISLVISHVSSVSCYVPCAPGDYFPLWALRFGPLIGLEIQAKHADHTLQLPLFINAPPCLSHSHLSLFLLHLHLVYSSSLCRSTLLLPSARRARML